MTRSQTTGPPPEPDGPHPQVPGCPAPVAPSGLGEAREERRREKEGKDEEDEREIVGVVTGKQQVESSMTKGELEEGVNQRQINYYSDTERSRQ